MWHNVRERFDTLGVTNVVWVMNYTGYLTGQCLTKDLWPGNDYVDWVMWDPYPKIASWTATVGSFYNYMTNNSDAEHDFLSKAWGLGEFGYVGSSQTAAYAMYDEARRNLQNGVHPRLKAYWSGTTTPRTATTTASGSPRPISPTRWSSSTTTRSRTIRSSWAAPFPSRPTGHHRPLLSRHLRTTPASRAQ